MYYEFLFCYYSIATKKFYHEQSEITKAYRLTFVIEKDVFKKNKKKTIEKSAH